MKETIFRHSAPINEPIRNYAPGSPERASIKAKLEELASERINIPCIINGQEVETGKMRQAVM